MAGHTFSGVNEVAVSLTCGSTVLSNPRHHIRVPSYLIAYYWWAYIHPKAVRFFERQWLVNLILWGNYTRLRDLAIAELGNVLSGTTL